MKASQLRQEKLGCEQDKVAKAEIEAHFMEAGRLLLRHHARSNWQPSEIKTNNFQVNPQNRKREANRDD